MFIVVLLLAIFILWNNLKYYKKLFIPDKYFIQETNENLKKFKTEEEKELAIFMTLLMGIIMFSFYCVAANTFIDNKFLLGFAILELILTLAKMKNMIKIISGGKVGKRSFVQRLLYPLHTLFIGYFIYIYMINLS